MSSKSGARLHIGQVARESGLSPKTIRYYEGVGLVTPASRAGNGYRLFDRAALDRLQFIRRAQALGLALSDIGAILQIRDEGRAPCRHIVGLVQGKIEALDAQLTRLSELRGELVSLLARLEKASAEFMAEGVVCPCLHEP